MKKKIRFIINPNSGTSKGQEFPALINKGIDKNIFEVEIFHTEYAGHGEELGAEAVRNDYFAVIAVGGDGSVQEIAKATSGTKTLLGIIPKGSGNGLSRHLSIPMNVESAMAIINKGNSKSIDTLKVNNKLCLNVFGIGFDAHIANLFSKSKKRGYITYVKLVLREFGRFKPLELVINADGKEIKLKSFLSTIANGSQFGNNAMIAPLADITDGLIDVCTMKKFPFYIAPSLIYLLMKNKINHSQYYSMFRAKEITIHSSKPIMAHLDGEPQEFGDTVHVNIQPKSLKIIVP
ncbi:MAG: diacylglycerol kinase family lipid kinase [Bacteroidia bacterium]|nr:diacylglycerol kinase family lipid kinase [Bacteroidia bacterium]